MQNHTYFFCILAIIFSIYNCHYEKIGSEVKNIDDEIPFEIPDNWCWVRHNNIIEIFGGSQPPKSKFITEERAGYVRLYQIRDYGPNPAPVYIPIETAHKTTKQGDILLARYGASVGKVFWAENGAYNVAMAKVEKLYISNHILDEYLYLFYKAPLYQTLVLNNSRSAQAGFNKEDLDSLFIPVPPLAEQERIISHIKQFEPFLVEYDNLEQQATKLDKEIYDKLKKSILQYAIQGKLVEQDENDEPASVLLERIRAEKKAQLGKKYVESYIYKGDDNCYYEHIGGKEVNITEEIPFDLPNGWEWQRFNTITKLITCGYAATPEYVEEGMPFLSARNVKPYKFLPSIYKKINYDLYNKLTQKNKPQRGDILMTRVGAGIGEACIIDIDFDFAIYVSLTLIKLEKMVLPEYVLHWLNSPMGISTALKNIYGKDSSQGNLNVDNVRAFLFSLPPLAEQKRIVDKINEIFAEL